MSVVGLRLSSFVERWFPDAFALALVTVAIVFVASLLIGNLVVQTAEWFGAGFWGLVAFTMQMTMMIIIGISRLVRAGGKWLIEAPYVLEAAISLEVHLG